MKVDIYIVSTITQLVRHVGLNNGVSCSLNSVCNTLLMTEDKPTRISEAMRTYKITRSLPWLLIQINYCNL